MLTNGTKETVYLGVYCIEKCSFEIKVKYSGDYTMDINEEMILDFVNDSVGELHLKIPEDGQEFLTHFLICAYLINPEDVDDDIHLYVN